MSRTKEAVSGIPAIYRADTLDKMLYGYVRARLSCNASTSVTDAVNKFLYEFDLVDELDSNVAFQVYQRMHRYFRSNRGSV